MTAAAVEARRPAPVEAASRCSARPGPRSWQPRLHLDVPRDLRPAVPRPVRLLADGPGGNAGLDNYGYVFSTLRRQPAVEPQDLRADAVPRTSLISLPAAYAIVRYSFPGKRLLFSLLTAAAVRPGRGHRDLADPHLQLHLPPDDVDVGPRLRDDRRHVPADAHADRRRDEGPADRVRGGGRVPRRDELADLPEDRVPAHRAGRLAPGCCCRFIIVFNEYLVTLFVHPPGHRRPRRSGSST